MTTHLSSGRPPASSRANLHAVPHPEEQGPTARLRRNLGHTMAGRRLRLRSGIRALVIEQLTIGGQRAASTISYAENVVSSLGKTAGDRTMQATQRGLDRLAKQSDKLRAVQAGMRVRAEYRDGDLVPHPDGGVRTVTDTMGDQERLRERIAADIDDGSRRHRRLPAALRLVPSLVLTADMLLLLYFFSGITNVNWGRPVSFAGLFALLLAAMVTGISYAFFHFTGDRLQQYKDDTGTIPPRGLDMATNISMGLAGGAMVILAALMFVRMHTEVSQTLGRHSGSTAFVLGLTLALVSVLANTLVIAVHALDGSPEADRLDLLGQAVYAPLSLQQRLREQADTLEHEIAVVGREADRAAAEGITEAGNQRAEYDRIVDAARAVHQGTGPQSYPAVDPNHEDGVVGYRRPDGIPEVDQRSVDLTIHQIHAALGDERPGRRPGSHDSDSGHEQPAA